MKDCQQIQELINRKIDDELTAVEETELNDHLATCEACKNYFENMVKVHDNLTSFPTIKLQESIVDQLIASEQIKLDDDKTIEKKSFVNIWRSWYGIAVAAIVVLLIPLAVIGIGPQMSSNNSQFTTTEGSNDDSVANQMEADKNFSLQSGAVEEVAPEASKLKEASEYGVDNREVEELRDENIMRFTAVEASFDTKYNVEVIDNILKISLEGKQIYETLQWSENLKVKWIQPKEHEIIYTLYDQDNNVIDVYKIDLLNLVEESIKDKQ